MARWAKMPSWTIGAWLNQPVEWASLQGSPALIVFFHLRCEGCVHLALPQAEQMYRDFSARGVCVVAIHSSSADGHLPAVDAFLSAGGYTLPVGIDAAGEGWKPRTMEDWGVEGTPTLVLLDKRGQLRMKKLGHMDDQPLAAALELLLSE